MCGSPGVGASSRPCASLGLTSLPAGSGSEGHRRRFYVRCPCRCRGAHRRAAKGGGRLAGGCSPLATAGSAESSSLTVLCGWHERQRGRVPLLGAVDNVVHATAATHVTTTSRRTIVLQRAVGGSRAVAPRWPRLALLSRAAWLRSVDGMNGSLAECHFSGPSTTSSMPLLLRTSPQLVVGRSCCKGRWEARGRLLPVGHGWLC